MKHFRTPKTSLGTLGAEAAATLIASAADIALVMDADGTVRDAAFGSEDLQRAAGGEWLGRSWLETVTVESRPKIEALLKAARGAGADETPRPRQVNHPAGGGKADVPVLYSAVRLDRDGPIVALGRDLRSLAELQQRLVNAQQSLERDYARLRHLETRYRLLFKLTSEAVLVVDAQTRKVVEANPAAVALFGDSTRQIVGRTFPHGIEGEGVQAVTSLLATVRARGEGEDVTVHLAGQPVPVVLSATLFRQERAAFYLIRLLPQRSDVMAPGQGAEAAGAWQEAMMALPDAFVLTDAAGRIRSANTAFLDLVQLATEEQVRGEPLDRWIGRPGIDLAAIIGTVREDGSVRLLGTSAQGEYGAGADVELSAVALSEGAATDIAFVIRDVSQRVSAEPPPTEPELPHSVSQLTELVGRVPLKDIIRDTTDMIEQLCIQAALDLTGDNRASAAEMLGLSRQSLYVKLRRYGMIGDLDGDNAG
ncbi:Transcriptional regulator, PpsR [Caenispirillum salinarum AK4]|uniref:Transcriptional regulator, PpsR n=1 Tax=Caenispirillum salinarum AK4 TaxID=1238182 RepID=K9HXF5_9PROT|nr:transcriptional regulator PpsR [Caenispirillum salinarum]EKV32866.1 Transcriptional regulator, PpsR [Caenispirillum salinarum AK4]